MVVDPIGDFINRLYTASCAGKDVVRAPYSKMRQAIAHVLEKEGYIVSSAKKGKKVKKSLEVVLQYDAGTPRISGVSRVSKPSRRVYYSAKDIKPIKSGAGLLVLSTPEGIVSGSDARKRNVGGEALFHIW